MLAPGVSLISLHEGPDGHDPRGDRMVDAGTDRNAPRPRAPAGHRVTPTGRIDVTRVSVIVNTSSGSQRIGGFSEDLAGRSRSAGLEAEIRLNKARRDRCGSPTCNCREAGHDRYRRGKRNARRRCANISRH